MSYSKHNPGDLSREDGWTVTPRAITTIATIITILYSLQAPVRYVLALANTVDALTGRVTALEAIAAHEAGRQSTSGLRVDATRGRGAAAR
jgi:hypothetical protein